MKMRTEGRHARIGKRGSYILEAVIVLPPFVLAMILIIMIVPVTACFENSVFALCDEMRAEDIRAAYADDGPYAAAKVLSRIRKENGRLGSVRMSGYRYKFCDDGICDLIEMAVTSSYNGSGILKGVGSISFEALVRSRAFTGSIHDADKAPEGYFERDEKEDTVYVFPRRGERYHNYDCPFLHPAYRMVYLTPSIRKHFKPCSICDSADMQDGQAVCCFFDSGGCYHRASCPSVDKYYVEMSREDAENKGYSPCLTCGG